MHTRDLAAQTERTFRLPDHIPELDGIRGCAIAMVLAFHLGEDLPKNKVLNYAASFGWSGVDLFFVLSGFLITRILLRTQDRADYFRSFYIRRSLRIFPVYYWTLALVTALFSAVPVLRPLLPSGHDQIFYWLYLSNWTVFMSQINQQSFGHFWSLAVEEQFYWIWPAVVRRIHASQVVYVAATAMVVALVLRILSTSHWFSFWNTFARMDALMVGALCAVLIQRAAVVEWLQRSARFLLPLFAALGMTAVLGDRFLGAAFTDTIGLTLFSLAYGCLLLAGILGTPLLRRFLRSYVPTKLGRYSYGIYVYHQPLYSAAHALGIPGGIPRFVGTIAVAVGIAVASYELLEKRILQWKDRLAPTA